MTTLLSFYATDNAKQADTKDRHRSRRTYLSTRTGTAETTASTGKNTMRMPTPRNGPEWLGCFLMVIILGAILWQFVQQPGVIPCLIGFGIAVVLLMLYGFYIKLRQGRRPSDTYGREDFAHDREYAPFQRPHDRRPRQF